MKGKNEASWGEGRKKTSEDYMLLNKPLKDI
jgi:hypothetical protein